MKTLSAFCVLLGCLFALMLVQPGVAASRDTVLVTRIESQDTSGQVLGASNFTWQMISGDQFRQRQFSDSTQPGGAKLELEQVFDLAGRTLQAQALDAAGMVIRRSEHTYDGQGRLIRLVFFDAAAQAAWRYQIITYSHRQDGQVDTVVAKDTLGNILSKLVYRYDANGRLLEAEEFRQAQTFQSVRHRWSQDGLQDTVLTLAGGTDSVEVRLKVMNEQGKVTSEWVSLRLSNGLWFSRETRNYYGENDEAGLLLRQDNHDANGVWIGRVAYRYATITLTPPVTGLNRSPRSSIRPIKGQVFRLDGRKVKAGFF